MSIPVREASDDVPAAKSGSDGLVRPPAGPLRPAPRNPWDPARSSCSWATVNGASGHTLGSGSRRLHDRLPARRARCRAPAVERPRGRHHSCVRSPHADRGCIDEMDSDGHPRTRPKVLLRTTGSGRLTRSGMSAVFSRLPLLWLSKVLLGWRYSSVKCAPSALHPSPLA